MQLSSSCTVHEVLREKVSLLGELDGILSKFHILKIEFLHEKIIFFGLDFFSEQVSGVLKLRNPPFIRNPPLVCPGSATRGGFLMKLINILIFVKGPPFAFRWLLYGICSKRKGSPLYISLNTGFGQNVKGPPFAFRCILYCFRSKRKGSPLCIFSKNIAHSKCKGSPLCEFFFWLFWIS